MNNSGVLVIFPTLIFLIATDEIRVESSILVGQKCPKTAFSNVICQIFIKSNFINLKLHIHIKLVSIRFQAKHKIQNSLQVSLIISFNTLLHLEGRTIKLLS